MVKAVLGGIHLSPLALTVEKADLQREARSRVVSEGNTAALAGGHPGLNAMSIEARPSRGQLGPAGHLWALLISPSFSPKLVLGSFCHLELKGLWHVESWGSGSRWMHEGQGS